MIRAVKLYADADGHSHFIEGTVAAFQLTKAISLHFKVTPSPHFYDLHTAPNTQYVLTLTGSLDFTTSLGETFSINPGDVLIATDTSGLGHKWQLSGEMPWKRAYVVFAKDEDINFTPNQ